MPGKNSILLVQSHRRKTVNANLLREVGPVQTLMLDATTAGRCTERLCVVFDVDLTDREELARVRTLTAEIAADVETIVLADRSSRVAVIQANAVGASHVAGTTSDVLAYARALVAQVGEDPSPAAGAAACLEDLFERLRGGLRVDPAAIRESYAEMAESIGDLGISDWLDGVRKHHSGTFQHCLLVTGIAIAFGRVLRLPEREIEFLGAAGLLHDIGKAKIPTAILDKNGPLDPEERAVIRFHPIYGDTFLRRQGGVPDSVLHMVRHHHEALDGSGYPDGLKGDAIPKLTRMLTISDIMGAFVEERAYKPALPPFEAYARLLDFAAKGQVDRDLVRRFQPVVEGMKG